MGTILDAPVMTVEGETAEGVPSESLPPELGLSFSPATVLEAEASSSADPATARPLMPDRRRCLFPGSHDPERRAQPSAVVSAYSWPALPSLILPSPGSELAKEFDVLYEKYRKRVYRQCYRVLGNPEDAEDLTQEVFLRLYQKIHTFRGEANFSTWLHSLTLNTVFMQLRRFRRWRGAVTSLDVAPGAEDGGNDTLTLASAVAMPATTPIDKLSLDVAMAQLPSGYKEVFHLHDVEGYRHHEIAALLGISEGTSKSQLHKARLRLRSLIGPADNRHDSTRSH